MARDDGRRGAQRISGGGGGAAKCGNAAEVFAGGFASGWICEVVLLGFPRLALDCSGVAISEVEVLRASLSDALRMTNFVSFLKFSGVFVSFHEFSRLKLVRWRSERV